MNQRIKWILFGGTTLALIFTALTVQAAVPATPPVNDSTHVQVNSKLLGKAISVSQNTDPTAGQLGVQSQTLFQFLGKTKTLSLFNVLGNTSIPTANWYINGTRVLGGNFAEQNGVLSYNANLAPIQIEFPVFSYPLGPIVLEVVSGVSFQGGINSQLQPILSTAPGLVGDMSLDLSANAFVEADGRFLFYKAGIGGQITAFDGKTGTHLDVTLSEILAASNTSLSGYGAVSFLGGDIYGFIDSTKKNFYQWSGKCYSFDGATPCVQ